MSERNETVSSFRSIRGGDERIEIGWIGQSAIPLTEQAQRYLEELRAVVSDFGVELID